MTLTANFVLVILPGLILCFLACTACLLPLSVSPAPSMLLHGLYGMWKESGKDSRYSNGKSLVDRVLGPLVHFRQASFPGLLPGGQAGAVAKILGDWAERFPLNVCAIAGVYTFAVAECPSVVPVASAGKRLFYLWEPHGRAGFDNEGYAQLQSFLGLTALVSKLVAMLESLDWALLDFCLMMFPPGTASAVLAGRSLWDVVVSLVVEKVSSYPGGWDTVVKHLLTLRDG